MVAVTDEIAKAEVEAWHKTHYRLDWLLYRTLGYAFLSSTLAIYIFWAEAGRTDHPILAVWLSLTWMLLLGMAMLWYDFHTRVSYENWPEVRTRLWRHLVVSVLAFAAALVFANAIHGVSILVDRAVTAPSETTADGKPNVAPDSNITVPPVHWRKGMKPDLGRRGKAVNEKKARANALDKAADPAATTPAPKTGTATTTSVTKPRTAKPEPAKAAPAKETPAKAKPAPKKASLPATAREGTRVVWKGQNYHYYGGRWHLVRSRRS